MLPSLFKSKRLTSWIFPEAETYVFAPPSPKVPFEKSAKPDWVHTFAEGSVVAERFSSRVEAEQPTRRVTVARITIRLIVMPLAWLGRLTRAIPRSGWPPAKARDGT